ncbi:MAG: RluA family pseudouridine synthase [Candidatus Levybacteria bacterium]|nr:RluA family pseudouridine synthase [Candidatus Levybacteria bacterium]
MGKLNVIYEDDDLLVINKPAGVTVNRSETTKEEETIQDLVQSYLHFQLHQEENDSEIDDEEESDFVARCGIVHRIDKETSGVLLIAKNEKSFVELQRQFKSRIVHKTYIALAHGRIVPEEGTINVPVGRVPWNRRQFGVVPGGKESVSTYKVDGYFRTDDKKKEILTLVKVMPLTGRTHQIRVHLQYIGFPIFADFLYAGRKTQKNDRKLLGRVFLHAFSISFTHPSTGNEVSFNAPLPQELEKVMDHLIPIV